MAKVNFKQQKRQRELARKTRQEQKQLKRTSQPGTAAADGTADDPGIGNGANPAGDAQAQPAGTHSS
jgi:hypothetical protein